MRKVDKVITISFIVVLVIIIIRFILMGLFNAMEALNLLIISSVEKNIIISYQSIYLTIQIFSISITTTISIGTIKIIFSLPKITHNDSWVENLTFDYWNEMDSKK